MTSKQREKEAEAQRAISSRDREIANLKERLRVISKTISLRNGEKSAGAGEHTTELDAIIKQANKERLHLERHLAIATSVSNTVHIARGD